MNKPKIKFTNEGTHDGHTEWSVYLNGEWVGNITRETPARYHHNGVSGLVLDREALKLWDFRCGETDNPLAKIPAGASANDAKRIVRQALGGA